MNTNTTTTQKTYPVTLVNITDGSVQGHKAGCADLTRGNLRNHADEPFELEVTSKYEAKAAYNGDFDEETDGWYEIDWAVCANHVPATDAEEAEEEAPKVTAKRTSKAKATTAKDKAVAAKLAENKAKAVEMTPEAQAEYDSRVAAQITNAQGPTFEEDLATARRIMAELPTYKSIGPVTVKAFLEAKDDAARQDVVDDESAGWVRRGFRELARKMEGKGDQEAADAFWALCDDIEPDGEVFVIDTEEA